MSSDGVNSYTWDRANRLLSMGGASYQYDGEGRRVQQTVGATITKYLLDIQPSLAVVLSETTGANTMRYVHSPRGIHAHKDTGGNWEWMLQDGLGSVREVVDNSVGVLESRNYDPYGNAFGATGTNQTGFGFTGELVDGSGLLDLRARRYNAGVGVFASLDPFEGTQNRVMSLNGYSWVEGNVPNGIDPTGMQVPIPAPSATSFLDWLQGAANQLNQCGGSYPCMALTLGGLTLAAIVELGIRPEQIRSYHDMNAMLEKEREYVTNPPVAVPSTYPDKKLNEDWQKLEPSWMRPPNGNGPDWWKLLGLGLAVAAPNLFRVLVERICWGCLGSNQPSPAPVATPDYKPTATPTPTPTATEQPEYIYRVVGTGTSKGVALQYERDWLTGLSFYDGQHEPVGRYLKYRVIRSPGSGEGVLYKDSNFIVRYDGSKPQIKLPFFGNEPYIGAYDDGVQQRFPEGHATVYHISQSYWDEWYKADSAANAASKSGPAVYTPQMEYFFNLRET